jgi:uncharacterized protein (DUF1684 family)
MSRYQELLDYRRTVAEMYARVRASTLDPAETCRRFRSERDELFRSHPQSALSASQKSRFMGLAYYDYDPAWRFVLPIDYQVEPLTLQLDLHDDGPIRLRQYGQVCFEVGGETFGLSLFWVMGYGGGVFLHFRDATHGHETNGGGRYLLDTIKHADLGSEGDKLVIDFNYAYNPSCAYNTNWVCPLLSSENRLPIAIPAGERMFADYE